MVKSLLDKNKFGFTLFLFTILITTISFIFNAQKSVISNDMDFASWGYFLFTAISHAATFALIPYLLIYLPLSFIVKNNKVATSIFVVYVILFQIFILLDGFVFNLYRFHINGFVLELVLGGGGEIFVFDSGLIFKFILFVLFTCILPYILVVFISKRIYVYFTKTNNIVIGVFLFVCVLVGQLGHAWAVANKQTSIQKAATILPYFFPLTANSLLAKLNLINLDSIDNMDYNVPSAGLKYPLNKIEVTDSIPNYNILYIAIDSWNPNTFDSIVTPNIYKFSQKGHVFHNHLSSSNGTRGSIFGTFFGVSFTYEKDFIISKISPLLIDQLLAREYSIQTFPSANFTSPPFNEIIFRRVPDINVHTEGKNALERDTGITEMALNYIDNQDKESPSFVFMFYDLPHAMSIPEKYRTKFQPSWAEADYMSLNNEQDPIPFFNLYKNCVYRTDSLIGNVLNLLDEKKLLENTVIIITGDHGQEFNENKKNYWGHGGNYSEWQIKVPFIMFYPEIESNKHYYHTTTHYDVSPTLLGQFLGVCNPSSDYSMGYEIHNTCSRYPHLVGDHVNYGFVFENSIVTTNHLGTMTITDKGLNDIPRSTLKISDIEEAIDKKNKFYKK